MEHSQPSPAQHFVRITRELFGYGHLRPGQEAALCSIFEGHDTLVVMPTGCGKSWISLASGIALRLELPVTGSVLLVPVWL